MLNFLAVIGFIFSVIALIRGRLFKIKSRKQALALMAGCFVALICFGSQGTGKESSQAMQAQPPTQVQTQVASTDQSKTTNSVVVTTTEKKWVKIGSWSGTGIKTTELFTISGNSRLSWQATDNNSNVPGIFQIFIYDKNNNLVNLLANNQGSTKDISYLHLSEGQYYISVNSALSNWNVMLEQEQ